MKRLFDVVAVLLIFPLLFPILAVLGVLVHLKLGSPIFFRQQRSGLNAAPFQMIKFRTMTTQIGADGKLLPDSLRLTRFGRWMRDSSLDELPELWNVFKGEMSLVGPRPLLPQYDSRYTERQARRHKVRPGLTGWAQVNGRNAISWEEKLEMDVWYVERQSIALDLKILGKTFFSVLRRKDINPKHQEIMPEFMGSKDSASEG